MSIIGWIVLGLIAGFIASKIVGGSGQGIAMSMCQHLGIELGTAIGMLRKFDRREQAVAQLTESPLQEHDVGMIGEFVIEVQQQQISALIGLPLLVQVRLFDQSQQ